MRRFPFPTPHLRALRAGAVGLALPLVLVACGDSGPPPPRPTSINLFPSQTAFDAVGDTRLFVANVRDQDGLAMDDQPVTWTSSDPGVVSIDATGRARAESEGSATIRATAGDALGEAPVTVTQTPSELAKRRGDGQAAAAGTALPFDLEVQLSDRLGSGIPGRTVRFTVTGGGAVEPSIEVTDDQGFARASWVLGPRAGEPQEARATLDGGGLPGVVFSATGYPGPPAELRARSGDGQVGLVGLPLPFPLSVQLLDAFENPLPTEVAFQVVTGGGSVSPDVVATGVLGIASTTWTLGPSTGTQRVRASAGDLEWEFIAQGASSAGPPETLEIVSGDGQVGPAGAALADPLIVTIRDAAGIGVSGVSVTFTPSEGSAQPAVTTTNDSGLAATTWALGPTVGSQSMQVSAAGLPVVTFGADARDPGPTCVLASPDPSRFDITLCYVTSVSGGVEAAFESARQRWEALIVGDIPDLPPPTDAHTVCTSSAGAPPIQGPLLDDVVIYVTIEPIDGEFNVLGSAGPCYIRDVNSGRLTVVGRMRFDEADMDRLEQNGQLDDVILHEMGHVLGLGILWEAFGFLENRAPDGQTPPGPDTHFDGPLAIAAFDASGGQARTAGQKVPVQNVGSSGSINGHWRESVMDRELMTPFLDGGVANPLSIVTVQSMADLGYVVSNAEADAFVVPNVNATLRGTPGTDDVKIPLVDDILWMPLRVVDEQGRVIRVVPPGGG